ncbi:MAG TPA: hypothetical protein VIS06_19235 [Mycobacteriales bacterium]
MGRLARIPILMIVLGFGSLILKQFNYHFTLLAWADDYQPAAGAVIGLLGVVILLLLRARSRAGQTHGGPAGPAGPVGSGNPGGPTAPGYTGPGYTGPGGYPGAGGPANYGPPAAAPMPPGSPMPPAGPVPGQYNPNNPSGPAGPPR